MCCNTIDRHYPFFALLSPTTDRIGRFHLLHCEWDIRQVRWFHRISINNSQCRISLFHRADATDLSGFRISHKTQILGVA